MTLGGINNPLRAFPGQSMVTSANGRDLWVAREGTGIGLYRNFITGGDRPPDFILTSNGVVGESFWPTSLWLDTTRDILYCTYKPQMAGGGTNRLLAWHNASVLTANVSPSRTITVSDARELSSIAGDPNGDRAYLIRVGLTGFFEVGVLDNLSVRSGSAPADRVISNVVRGWTGIACDQVRDILYLQRANLNSGDHGVAIVTNASSATGDAPYRLLQGPATGMQAPAGRYGDHVPTCLRVFPGENLLFVATTEGDIMAFENASALDGDVAPIKTAGLVGVNPTALLVWISG